MLNKENTNICEIFIYAMNLAIREKANSIMGKMYENLSTRQLFKNPCEYFAEKKEFDFNIIDCIHTEYLQAYFLNIAIRTKNGISLLLQYFECFGELVEAVRIYEKFPKLSKKVGEDWNFSMEEMLKKIVYEVIMLASKSEVNQNEDYMGVIQNLLSYLPKSTVVSFIYDKNKVPEGISQKFSMFRWLVEENFMDFKQKTEKVLKLICGLRFSQFKETKTLNYHGILEGLAIEILKKSGKVIENPEATIKNLKEIEETINFPMIILTIFQNFISFKNFQYLHELAALLPLSHPLESIKVISEKVPEQCKELLLLNYLQRYLHFRNVEYRYKPVLTNKFENSNVSFEDCIVNSITEYIGIGSQSIIPSKKSLFIRSLVYLNINSVKAIEKLFTGPNIFFPSEGKMERVNLLLKKGSFTWKDQLECMSKLLRWTKDPHVFMRIVNYEIAANAKNKSDIIIAANELAIIKGNPKLVIEFLSKDLKLETCAAKIVLDKGIFVFKQAMNLKELIKSVILSKFDDEFLKKTLADLVKAIFLNEIPVKLWFPKCSEFLYMVQMMKIEEELRRLMIECTIENFQYFLMTINCEEFAKRIFFQCVFSGMYEKTRILRENYKFSEEILENGKMLAVIGLHYGQIANAPVDKLDFLISDLVREVNPYLHGDKGKDYEGVLKILEKSTLKYVNLNAFLGDTRIIQEITNFPASSYLEALNFTLIGLKNMKKYSNSNANIAEIRASYLKIHNFFAKYFTDQKTETFTSKSISQSEFLQICFKFQRFSLLVSCLPHLFSHDFEVITDVFYKIASSNIKNSSKRSLFTKMLENSFSPEGFLEKCIKKFPRLLRNYKLLQVIIDKNLGFIEKSKENLGKLIGNLEIIRKIGSVSNEGIAKYGKKDDIDGFFAISQRFALNLLEMCKLAIKSRNRIVIKQILQFFPHEDYYSLLAFNQGEYLFDLAFYALDDIAELFFKLFSEEELVYLAQIRCNGITAFMQRLLIDEYAVEWEPLNLLFADLLPNRYFITIYFQKFAKKHFASNFSLFTELCNYTQADEKTFKNTKLKIAKFEAEIKSLTMSMKQNPNRFANQFKLKAEIILKKKKERKLLTQSLNLVHLSKNPQAFQNFIHRKVLNSTMEKKADFIRILLGLHMYPSQKVVKTAFNSPEIVLIYTQDPDYSVLERYKISKSFTNKSGKIQYSQELFQLFIEKMCVDGDKVLLQLKLQSYLTQEYLGILLVNGHVSMFMYCVKSSGKIYALDTMFFGFDEDLSWLRKGSLWIAFMFLGILPINCIDEVFEKYGNNRISDFNLHLMKAVEIVREVCGLLKIENEIEENALLQFSEKLKKLENELVQKFNSEGALVEKTQNFNEMIKNCFRIDYILAHSLLNKLLIDSSEMYKNCEMSHLIIDANSEDSCIRQNDKLKITVNFNYAITESSFHFLNFSYPDIEKPLPSDLITNALLKHSKLIEKSIRYNRPDTKIQLCFVELPKSPKKFYSLLEYFENRCCSLETILFEISQDQDSVNFNEVEKYDENTEGTCIIDETLKFNLQSAEYPSDLIQSFSKIGIPEIIFLKVEDCKFYFPQHQDMIQCEFVEKEFQGIGKGEAEKNWSFDCAFNKFTFLPYVIFKIKTVFKCFLFEYWVGNHVCPVEMNYVNYFEKVILRICKFKGVDPYSAISSQTSLFFSLFLSLSYLQSVYKDIYSSLKGIYIDFDENSTVFQMKTIGKFLCITIGFENNQKDSFKFHMPDMNFPIEDLLICLLTPSQICEHLSQKKQINKLLESTYRRNAFSFSLDWNSIFNAALPYLSPSQNYRFAMQFLRSLGNEIAVKIKGNLFSEDFIVPKWDEIMLINSFYDTPDVIELKKKLFEENFCLGKCKPKAESRFFYIYKNRVKKTLKLQEKDLLSGHTILVGNSAGFLFNLPKSCLPRCGLNNTVVFPEIGNILNPFPDILSISLDPKANIQIHIESLEERIVNQKTKNSEKYSKVIRKLFSTKKNKSLLKITTQPFTTYLKRYFFYYFSLNQSIITDYFNKLINPAKPYIKKFHGSKICKVKTKIQKSKIRWSPKLEFKWDSFFTTEQFEYLKGMQMGKNLVEKLEYFLNILDTLFNYSCTNESFRNLGGNVYVRPKGSELKKLVAKYFLRIDVLVCDKDFFSFIEGVPTLCINPLNCYTESVLSRENTIRLIAEYLIFQELSVVKSGNVKILYETIAEDSFICSLNRLLLLSQVSFVSNLLELLSHIYGGFNDLNMTFNLNIYHEQCSKLLSKNSAVFGVLFYNQFSCIEFGENMIKLQNRVRPFNSLFLRKNIVFQNLLEKDPNSMELVPISPNKYFSSKRIKAKKIKFIPGKENTKNFLVAYYHDFPVFLAMIGHSNKFSLDQSAKYNLFCTKSLSQLFIPIIKPSDLLKIHLNSLNSERTYVLSNTTFTFYLISKKESPQFKILNKNVEICYTIEKVEISSVYKDRKVYLVSVLCQKTGDYIVFTNDEPIAANFIISLRPLIDPSQCLVLFKKFTNTLIVELVTTDGKDYIVKNNELSIQGNEFWISSQKIFVQVSGKNLQNFQISTNVNIK